MLQIAVLIYWAHARFVLGRFSARFIYQAEQNAMHDLDMGKLSSPAWQSFQDCPSYYTLAKYSWTSFMSNLPVTHLDALMFISTNNVHALCFATSAYP